MKLIPTLPCAVTTLPQGFEFRRALTRGRIEGLQSALRILAQQADQPELLELRSARLSLCDRLQAQYAQFLGEAPAGAGDPGGPSQFSGDVSRCVQLRRLLQEDLAWVRSLPGDHQDLARAFNAGLERVAPHAPL